MSQRCDVIMPKDREAVFIHGIPVRLLGMLVSLLGVFQSLPGALLPGLMILFLMGFRSAAVSMGGTIVQLGSLLMIFVM
ncbi:MAG: hypothetical protein ABSH40_15790 [Bryobacteraceae bacterium]|jgi:hypothetical protein